MVTPDKVDKKEQILAAAEQLFAEKGFDGTSVRDIAHEANVNLAMISYYFGSKEKLLESLIEQRFRTSIGVLEELSNDQSLTPWDKIDRLIDYYVERIVTSRRFHNIMNQEYNTDRSSDIKELITRIKLQNLERIKKIILDGQNQKIFRKVDVELTLGTIMGTIAQVTSLRKLYCNLLQIDTTDEDSYREQVIPRLKTHLRQLMRAHLDFKNEE
ncbi:MAG: TetR family transcriptional regulator [Chitinophagaceae bacterium]